MEATHKWVGNYLQDLASGRTMAPGDEVTLSSSEAALPHNARLIEGGGLIPLRSKKPKETTSRRHQSHPVEGSEE